MEHFLNRKEFFNILQKITKQCNKNDYYNKYFEDIPKFKELLEMIDLDSYDFNYIQNRFISIKSKTVELKDINQIILCSFDTAHNVFINEDEKCENIVYEYQVKKRNSYLTKPINEEERKNFTENINEKDCIKGKMDSSILNSILIYMLNHYLIGKNSLILFTLKNHDNKWQSIDVLEYLQKYIDKDYNRIKSIIDLDFCSQPKGMPKKDYTGKIEVALNRYPTIKDFVEKNTKLEKFKNEYNYDYTINRDLKLIYDRDFSPYKEITNYFNIPILIKSKLFIFTDKEPTNKFSTFFLEKPFLTEWSSVEKFINILINLTNF